MSSSTVLAIDDDVSSITNSAEARKPDAFKQADTNLAKADARHRKAENELEEAEDVLTEAEERAGKAYDELHVASEAMHQYQRHGMWWQPRSEEEKAARAQLKQLRKKSNDAFRLQHDALAQLHDAANKESEAHDGVKLSQKAFMAAWRQKCVEHDEQDFDHIVPIPSFVGITIACLKPRWR